MTDPQEPNHWDLLSSELGVPSPTPEEKKPVVEADAGDEGEKGRGPGAPVPPSRAGRPRKDPAPKPPRAPTDWSRVAEQLGVERLEEALQPTRPEAGLVPGANVAHVPTAPSPEPDLESMELPVAPAETVVQSTRTDLVPVDTEAELPGIPSALAALCGDREERASARKHRQRRHRPQRPGDEEPAEAAVDQTVPAPAAEPPERLDEGVSPTQRPDDAVVAVSSATGEQSQERSKRRRHRRGSGRKKGAVKRDDESAGPGAERELPTVEDESESSPETGDEWATPKPDDTNGTSRAREQASSDKPSKAVKLGHRGIPSWEEAIRIVISANMEARAKRPEGTSSRSRGGHNRAGRDKSSEKAS